MKRIFKQTILMVFAFAAFSWLNVANAQTDLCSGAAPALICGNTVTSTTAGATTDVGAPFCVTAITSPGVWYTFTGTGAPVTFSTCNQAAYDTKISVYSGSCAGLICVGGNDDGAGCAGFTSEITVGTSLGTSYFVLVHGFGGASGTFSLTTTCAPSITNDTPCGASTLTIGSPTPYNNIGAGADPGEVSPGPGSGPATCDSQDGWCSFETGVDNSIWYTFTAPSLNPGDLLEITLDNTVDLQAAVYTVGNCANYGTFTAIAGNDDGGDGLDPLILLSSTQLTAGNTYYLQLDGFAGTGGSGNIVSQIISLPANDSPCGAVPIPVVNGSYGPFDNSLATADPGEVTPGPGTNGPTCNSTNGWCSFEPPSIQNSLWFTFVAPPAGEGFDVRLSNTTDLQFAIWEVGDCANYGSFVEVLANDDDGAVFDPALEVNGLANGSCLTPE